MWQFWRAALVLGWAAAARAAFGVPAAAAVLAGSPAGAVSVAFADARRVPTADRAYQRYLWAPRPSADFQKLIRLQVNLLSDQGDFGQPVWVRPDLARLDVRDYGWHKRLGVWEKFAKTDVFFHQKVKFLVYARVTQYWPGGREGGKFFRRGRYVRHVKAGAVVDAPSFWLPGAEIDGLRDLLYSEAPILNAEWWFVQTARQISLRNRDEGTGYYDFLGLKDRKAFFRLTGLNEKLSEKLFQEWRAAVVKSGVSAQNRQVVVLRGVTGRVWVTLDTFTEQGRGVVKRNLRRGEFRHDVEELYGFLPNGLFVTLLSDVKGVAQDTAPDRIGPDDSSLRVGRDARIHVNLSCIRCHGLDRGFLKPIDDWARRTFTSGLPLSIQDYDRDVLLELRRQYLNDLKRLLARDRENYQDATWRLVGLDAADVARLYGRAWNSYVEDTLGPQEAAVELGVTPEVLLRRLKLYALARGGADLVLAGFLDKNPQRLTRLEWEDSYALAQAILAGVPPEVIRRVRRLR